jgi:integrase
MRRVMGTVGITGVQPTHGWRHTAATLLLDSGQNIKTIATRLGHSTPAITQALYVHPVAERDVESARHLGDFLKRKA